MTPISCKDPLWHINHQFLDTDYPGLCSHWLPGTLGWLCCAAPTLNKPTAGSSPAEGTQTRLFSLTELFKLNKLIGETQNFSSFQHLFVLYFNVMINFKATNTQSSAECLGQARKDKLKVLILAFGFLSHCHGLESE